MLKAIKNGGHKVSDYYAGTPDYYYLTPAGASLWESLGPVLEQHAKGLLLDAGAGRSAYSHAIKKHCREYVSVDIGLRPDLNAVGDLMELPFATGIFDTVFCSQVMEHVSHPCKAMAELYRVLKPGGILILTVPHISWLHNEPHDYFRFTRYGLAQLADDAGLEIAHTSHSGGLFCLLGHIFSTFWVNLTFGVPVLQQATRILNRLWVRMVLWLDNRLERSELFALNYLCLMQKPECQKDRKDD